jgi:adenylate kinase
MIIHDHRVAWLQDPHAECSPPVDNGGICWRVVLFGPPGAGKGTQATLLSHRLHACHLSTGELFRSAASHHLCAATPAMTTALEHMRRGALVPDSTVWEMVRERSGCLHCRGGFLLDGFPRTLVQAEALQLFLEEEKLPLSAVVDYELPLDEIISRLGGRRTCEQCDAVFHVTQQRPKVEGVCDHCGGALTQREDDHPESIAVRLEAYQQRTAPLIQYYRKLGLLLPVAAGGSADLICERTVAALQQHRQGLN